MDAFAWILFIFLGFGGTEIFSKLNERRRDQLNAQVQMEREKTTQKLAELYGWETVKMYLDRRDRQRFSEGEENEEED